MRNDIPIANNKILLIEASLKLCKEKLTDVLPMIKIICTQHKLRINRPEEFKQAAIIYVKSIKQC